MTPSEPSPPPKILIDPVIPIDATRPNEKPMASSTLRATQTFSGPMPPPDYLARYEQICTGAADRMLTMVENESSHRHQFESSL